jgi:putative ABC transport system substrate-binding protein
MRRLLLLALLALTALALGQAAATGREARVAVLGPAEEPRFSQIAQGLAQGLREHGYTEPPLEILQRKVPRGDRAAAAAATRELLQARVNVLFAIGSEIARVAREVTKNLPIVFITPGDPVAAGLAASLSHPGGNTTAMTFEYPELSAKRLQLLSELMPGARRVLVLYDPRDASPRQAVDAAREAAKKLGIALIEHEATSEHDLARGLEALTDVDGILAVPGGFPSGRLAEIVRAANQRRVVAVLPAREEATADALISYGAKDTDIAREAARLVDKVLKGENAGELPIERPTILDLVINLKTARRLGLAVPPSLLARADEVIE